MDTQFTQRPLWAIDHTLGALIGTDVRVAAKAFSPMPAGCADGLRFAPVRDLFLPDNSQPAGLPVYFEGRLRQFERQIGMVFVGLDAPASPDTAHDGPIHFRGGMAVILRGPAVVELALPFQVERLPTDLDNYWRDVRLPQAQFELPFPACGDEGTHARWIDAFPKPQTDTVSSAFDDPCPAAKRRFGQVDLAPASAVDRACDQDAEKGESCRSGPGAKAIRIRNWNCSRSTG